MPGAGWAFSHGRWIFIEKGAAPTKPLHLERSLRLATLNCLHDLAQPELLHHDLRHEAIFQELEALEADVIGLNEVTRNLLDQILRLEWVRKSYTVSAVLDDHSSTHLSTVIAGEFGNLLLSRLAPMAVEYVEQPGDGRHSHIMSLCLRESVSNRPLKIAVCSSHFTAAPWIMEGRRRQQLNCITSALTTNVGGAAGCRIGGGVKSGVGSGEGSSGKGSGDRGGKIGGNGDGFDACVVMGDFNFHREEENASIPTGWSEVPAVVALGGTWDVRRNSLLPHYLPFRNLYNGFGLSVRLGWPSPMRLDRILVYGAGLDISEAIARLFADQPIHERARARTPLPQTGHELRVAHRALPWQDYLHPSDHFGIVVELPARSRRVHEWN